MYCTMYSIKKTHQSHYLNENYQIISRYSTLNKYAKHFLICLAILIIIVCLIIYTTNSAISCLECIVFINGPYSLE